MTNQEIKNLLRNFSNFERAFTKVKERFRYEFDIWTDTLDFIEPDFFDFHNTILKEKIEDSHYFICVNENADFSLAYEDEEDDEIEI